MEKLYLVHSSDVYDAHIIGGTRFVTEFSGAGMPTVEHIVQRGAAQDGATLLRWRLQPRTLIVAIAVAATSRAGYWQERRALIDMLKRSDGLILRYVNDELNLSLDLDVVYEAGTEMDARSDWGLHGFHVAVQLKAYDPVWRSTERRSLVVGLPVTEDAGTFPAEFAWTLGSSLLYHNIAINYAGTWPSYPQVDIRGPVTNPRVVNTSTGEKLELDAEIPAGEVVRIDLAPGVKTVTNITTGENWMRYVTSDSNIATFHIAPHPEVHGGVNNIEVVGTLGGDETAIAVRWYDRYIGI